MNRGFKAKKYIGNFLIEFDKVLYKHVTALHIPAMHVRKFFFDYIP